MIDAIDKKMTSTIARPRLHNADLLLAQVMTIEVTMTTATPSCKIDRIALSESRAGVAELADAQDLKTV